MISTLPGAEATTEGEDPQRLVKTSALVLMHVKSGAKVTIAIAEGVSEA